MARRLTLIIAASIAAALLALPWMTQAQNTSAPPAATPREGDIYDYRKHQPTESAPTVGTTKQVDEEVKALLKQTQELDREYDEKEGKSPDRR